MCTKTRVSFKNRRFLKLKPPFLADETDLFSIKNHHFLILKVRNGVVFSSCRFSNMRFYAMQTWQIIVLGFLFLRKPRI